MNDYDNPFWALAISALIIVAALADLLLGEKN